MLFVVPSAFSQLIVVGKTLAPVKSVAVVIVNVLGSLVCTVQVPSLFLIPSFSDQSDGPPATAIVIRSLTSADGSLKARLIGPPATPAGKFGVPPPAPKFPATSV